jgi:putative ABC transport system permease protein
MRMMDCNRIALGAVLRAPLRTAMMLLATAIGVGAVLLLTSVGESARTYVSGQFQALGTRLVIVFPGKSETSGNMPGAMPGDVERELTLDDARAVQRSPYVEMLSPIVVGSMPVSYGGRERDTTVLGVSHDFMAIRGREIGTGEFLPDVDFDRAPPVCVLGRTVKEELFSEQVAVGKWLRVGSRRCRVVGVLLTEGTSLMIDANEIVIVPVAYAQALFDISGLFRIIVQAPGRGDIDATKRDITEIIKQRHYGKEDVTVITQDAVLATFDGIFDTLTQALAGIASISLVVAGVLIMNVMLVAVSQRTREVGLLKALGATRRQIIALFLTEAFFLASFGGLAGLAVGYIGVFVLELTFTDFTFTPPPWAVAAAFVVAIASGMIFGIMPARKAANLDPIAALAGRQS